MKILVVSIAVFGLVFLSSLPVCAQETARYDRQIAATPQGAGIPLWDEDTLLGIVHEAYERLQTRIADSGQTLRFDLVDFRTLPASAFDTLRWYEVATLPGGDVVSVSVGRHRQGDVELPETWTPRWVVWQDFMESEEAQKLGEAPLSAVVELLPAVVGLTRYTVTVTFEGKSRTYWASFLWLGEGGRVYGLEVVDHITQGVDVVLVENWWPRKIEAPSPPSPRLTPFFDPAVGVTCDVSAERETIFRGSGDSLGHVDGQHFASVEAEFNCFCSSDCRQECSVESFKADCQEIGEVSTACHKISLPAKDNGGQIVSKGQLDGAWCTAATGCAVKICFGCLCGTVTATVRIMGSGAGASASYTTPTPGAQAFGHKLSYQCDECRLSGGGDPTGGGSGGGGTTCETPDSCSSPLLIDLDGGNLQLTPPEAGVVFDIDGQGHGVPVAWTAAGSGDAFLVMDKNHNGVIDNGMELFGPLGAQVGDDPANGFQALALFDQGFLGGDEDGRITAADAYFGELRLWIDSDHDGVSQARELFTLEEFHITALELTYRNSQGSDPDGNAYRYFARVHFEDHRTTRMIDVLLRKGDLGP